jgi:hypothetical protein
MRTEEADALIQEMDNRDERALATLLVCVPIVRAVLSADSTRTQ